MTGVTGPGFVMRYYDDNTMNVYANGTRWNLRENQVSFSEDPVRKRKGYAAQNFPLIKQEASKKRPDVGWDHDYLIQILNNVGCVSPGGRSHENLLY
jgi:hypothetical protein